ncbi:MAG: tdh 1 [Anaerophaga sp.]|nr:tdh 1 [Anaerophaga sp.]
MENSAKAMVFRGSGKPLTLREFQIPTLKEGELLVQISHCAICVSDLHTISGKRESPLPLIPGHEIVGTIKELPPKSKLTDLKGQILQPGDMITWTLNTSCGKCFNCRKEIPQKCKHLTKYGHSPISEEYSLNGGMAEYILLRKGTSIIKLDNHIPAHLYTCINCSLSTVMAAIHAAGKIEGSTALIFGAGMLGTLCSAVLKSQKAEKIIAIDPNLKRLEIIQQFGTSHAIQWRDNLKTEALIRHILTITENHGADLVFEMSGAEMAISTALQTMGIGGKLILCGSVFPSRDISFNPETIVRNLWEIKGIHNYNTRDFLAAEKFLSNNISNFPFSDLFHPGFYSLEETEEAIKTARTKKFHRVVITP